MVRSSLPPHLQLHVVAPDPLEKNQEGDLPIETLVQKVPDHVGGHRRQESQGEIVANVAALDREGCRVTGPADRRRANCAEGEDHRYQQFKARSEGANRHSRREASARLDPCPVAFAAGTARGGTAH